MKAKHALLALAALPLLGHSQTTTAKQWPQVKSGEFEVRIGGTLPLGGFHDGDANIGPEIGVEWRHNFKQSPWDVGAMIDITTARYDFDFEGHTWEQSNRTCVIAAVGDYNFGQGRPVNFFVGTGLGLGLCDAVSGDYDDGDKSTVLPRISPRVGVELGHHLRLTLTSNIVRKGYSNVQLSVGYAIGGGLKK